MYICIYHKLNITELSNEHRQLTATFAKCTYKNETLYVPSIILFNTHIFFCLWEAFRRLRLILGTSQESCSCYIYELRCENCRQR